LLFLELLNAGNMIITEEARIDKIIIHKVGNKQLEEGLFIANTTIDIKEELKPALLNYLLSSFNSNEYYNFSHESDVQLNEAFSFTNSIFENPGLFIEKSKNLAQHLYNCSLHPKVKEGEFYVVYFNQLIIDGEEVDAIGLFKSEIKETFLKINQAGEGFALQAEDGINLNKLQKGCLIFNSEHEKGFVLSIVDNLKKGNEAGYWKDAFLQVRPREDDYFQTKNVMTMYKDFVTEQLPAEFEISKADQADMMNKSMKFLNEKENFDIQDFEDEVIAQPEIKDSFKNYKQKYEEEKQVKINNDFEVSIPAVKKHQKTLKSVIKLDKNFHVYVHGNRQRIVKGYDESTGLNYYQLFFEEEK